MELYLAEGLGWLTGYPAGTGADPSGSHDEDPKIPWRARARSGGWEDVVLDQERLRSSFYTLRGAPRKFPRALEGVVGDVEAWAERIERRLRDLQRAVHDGEPALKTGAKAEAWPELRSFAWDDDELFESATLTLWRWRSPLENLTCAIGRASATRFAIEVLAACGDSERLEPALTLLEVPGAFTTRTCGEAARQALGAVTNPKTNFVPGADPDEFDPDGLDPANDGEPIAIELVRYLCDETDASVRNLTLASLSAIQAQE